MLRTAPTSIRVTGCRNAATGLPNDSLSAVLEYDAFGQGVRSTGPASDLVPFHFSTKFTDQESGLNYYGYRYYDSGKGRWLNRDPMEEDGGVNLNSVCYNNLLACMDNLGLEPAGLPPEPTWLPPREPHVPRAAFITKIAREFSAVFYAIPCNACELDGAPDYKKGVSGPVREVDDAYSDWTKKLDSIIMKAPGCSYRRNRKESRSYVIAPKDMALV